MKKSNTFLDGDKLKKYDKVAGGFERSIIEVPVNPARSEKNPKILTEPQPLASYIKQLIGAEIRSFENKSRAENIRKWFGCACIEIKEEDGMTWSAEIVTRKLKESYPRFKVHCLAKYKQSSSLPVISNLIGEIRLLRLAGKNDLGTLLTRSSQWVTLTIIIVAILALALIKILESADKASPSLTTYLTIIASAAVALVSEYLINYLMERTTPKKIEDFKQATDKIREENEFPENYRQFVDGLAADLQTIDFPRFLIVDDYEDLDPITKDVIKSYFEKYAEDAEGSEYWIIFEGQDGDKFSTEISDAYHLYGYKYSRSYQQLFLNDAEKKKLREELNLPLAALNYQAIKLICNDTSEGKERVQKLVAEYRRDHPKRDIYGNLEFLYLISLTGAMPGNFYLDTTELSAGLAERYVRADVLPHFLHGTKLAKAEFEQKFKEIEQLFPSLLISKVGKYERKVHIYYETTLALSERADALNLPFPELGHLYWSLYWYNQSRKGLEAYKIRKLNYHLKNADPITFQGIETNKKILNEFIEASIFAIDESLKIGLFEDIEPILQKYPLLLELEGAMEDMVHQRRFLKQCWEAYSVLGYDTIFGIIIDILALRSQQPQTGRQNKKKDLLGKLFFESMPLFPARRATLTTDFFHWVGGQRDIVKSISNYAKVRSAWLALSLNPIVRFWDSIELCQAVRQSDKELQDIAKEALTNIDSSTIESIRFTDIATLSLALWCNALRFNPTMKENTKNDYYKNFKALVELATDVVLKASDLKDISLKVSERGSRVNVLVSAIVKELYAISLVAIITANQYLLKHNLNIIDQPLLDKIDDLLEFSEVIFNYPLPGLQNRQHLTSANLLKKIDEELKFCGIIWNRFGLYKLLEFINIRRVHFKAICLGVNYAREDDYEFALETIGSVMNEANFTGLIANLVIADCLREAGEMEAFYLLQAATLAAKGDLGRQFQQELSFSVILEIHNLNYDIDVLLENLLMKDEHGEYALLQLLKQFPEESLDRVVLAIFNAQQSKSSPEIISNLQRVVASIALHIKSSEVKSQIEAMSDYFSIFGKVLHNEKLNISEISESWKDRKSSPFYAGLLHMLIENSPTLPHLWQEALHILDHNPQLDHLTTHLSLATKLATLSVFDMENKSQPKEILLRYLREGVERWKSNLSAEKNIQIYGILLSLDQNRVGYYASELNKWQYIKLRRFQLEQLPKLVREGEFFIIFLNYVTTMLHFGIALDAEAKKMLSYLNYSAQQKLDYLTEWRENGSQIPDPLKRDIVSTEFIVLGALLFSRPINQNEIFREARNNFNRVAQKSISDLIDVIMRLPSIPPAIKDTLHNYSQKFLL